MTCIIIEDEPLALDILERHIHKTPLLQLQGSFRSPIAAMTFLQQNTIDLLFLDINMPDLNGIQLLKSLTRRPLVIFTTAYSQYALESYDWNAVDYLLKPIELERFLKAVNKAQQAMNSTKDLATSTSKQEPKVFFLKSGPKTFKVLQKDILYIEAAENYVAYISKDRKILVLDSLSKLEVSLPKSHFIRIHKSYIVALEHIDIMERSALTINDKRLPIGRAYRKALFEQIDKRIK